MLTRFTTCLLLLALTAPSMAVDRPGMPHVVLETSLGNIEIEVDIPHASRTSQNFLRYVREGHYDGGSFHRTVRPDNQPDKLIKIEVVQAGARAGTKDFPPIKLERTSRTGLSHLDGTVSMARDGPDSATSDFFICIGNQPSLDYGGLRNPDGQGFAAFARVLEGMDVVRKIQAAPANGQSLGPPVLIRRAYVK